MRQKRLFWREKRKLWARLKGFPALPPSRIVVGYGSAFHQNHHCPTSVGYMSSGRGLVVLAVTVAGQMYLLCVSSLGDLAER
jgi:hypothetical protein